MPTILPPSVGEMVPAAPNRYRVGREAETLNPGTPQPESPLPESFDHVIPVPPVQSDQLSADEFYGENHTAPAAGTSPVETKPFPAASLNGAAAALPEAAGLADTGKQADAAPLAESDQAPIHHG